MEVFYIGNGWWGPRLEGGVMTPEEEIKQLKQKNAALTSATITMNMQISQMREVINYLTGGLDAIIDRMKDGNKRDAKIVAIADGAMKKAIEIGDKFHEYLAAEKAKLN